MFKNVAAKIMVFAFDTTTNTAKTGDAANITAYIAKDYGTVTVLGDTSATEMDSTNAKGYYLFDVTATEVNADVLLVSAKSTTANIAVIGAPPVIFTRPQTGWLAPTTAARTLTCDASGNVTLADAVSHGGTLGSSTATLALSRVSIVSQSSNTNALTVTGNGTGNGAVLTSGAGATGDGVQVTSGSTNGNGFVALGTGTGSGFKTTGGSTGHGINAASGSGATGNAINAVAGSTNGNGLATTGTGTGNGILTTGGAGAGGDGLEAAAGGGVPIRGNITGNITGTLDTVTTATNVTTVNGLAANVITASAIAADAIGASELAADAAAEIAAAVWDLDATAHQTAGTFGQAIGDPGADTNTIFGAVVTGAAGATIAADIVSIQADTDDIQSKIGTPAGASVSVDIAAVKTDTAAVKVQTDKLTFTVANQVDANIQYVNDVLVTGNGQAGTEWGP